MRTVYLIRHGEPAFPGGQKICLGVTDLPLSRQGRLQAAVLSAYLPGLGAGNIFSSPLKRARETAEMIGPSEAVPGLRELDMGLWDGIPFSEIREHFPVLYAQRGEDPFHTCVPGGEAPAQAVRRMHRCVDSVLSRSDGDIVLVSHRGVIRSYLCGQNILAEMDCFRQDIPYTGVTKLILNKGVLTPEYIGRMPKAGLTRTLCLKLLQAAGTPENIVRHSLAVEKRALMLAEGFAVNRELLSCAALLHDMLRTEPCHEAAAADALEALGYSDVAALVRTHSDLPSGSAGTVCEASLLYIADKTVTGEQPVTLEERFRTTLKKCTTPEAREAHARRFRQAERILSLLERS